MAYQGNMFYACYIQLRLFKWYHFPMVHDMPPYLILLNNIFCVLKVLHVALRLIFRELVAIILMITMMLYEDAELCYIHMCYPMLDSKLQHANADKMLNAISIM